MFWTGRQGASITPALSLYVPVSGLGAQVAQLVEHAIENRSVGGSIPPLGTITRVLLVLRFRFLEGSAATRVHETAVRVRAILRVTAKLKKCRHPSPTT